MAMDLRTFKNLRFHIPPCLAEVTMLRLRVCVLQQLSVSIFWSRLPMCRGTSHQNQTIPTLHAIIHVKIQARALNHRPKQGRRDDTRPNQHNAHYAQAPFVRPSGKSQLALCSSRAFRPCSWCIGWLPELPSSFVPGCGGIPGGWPLKRKHNSHHIVDEDEVYAGVELNRLDVGRSKTV